MPYRLSATRRAFTLAELVVSIGILVLMMSLAGQVFNLTVKSTGQATALTEVMQELRAFEHTLRDDLRGVQPGNSLVLIQGNPINAYWTQNGKDADGDGNPSNDPGYPSDPEREEPDSSGRMVRVAPRADILMIFTARPGASFVEAGASQPTSNLQQVVYGHAELGDYAPSGVAGPKYTFERATGDKPYFPVEQNYPSPLGVAAVPAAQWHLARRSVLLLPTPPPSSGLSWNAIKGPLGAGLGDTRILEGGVDVVGDFQYEKLVVRPASTLVAPWFLPDIFGDVTTTYTEWSGSFARSKLDPSPPAAYAGRIGHYLLPNCASFKVEWSLNPRSEFVAGRLNRTNEVFWFDPGDNGDPAKTVRTPDPLRSLGARVNALKGGRSQCDPNDPLCRNLESLLNDRAQLDALARYSLSDRFRGRNFAAGDPDAWNQLAPDGNRPNLVVFTASRPALSSAGAPPGAPPSEPVFDPMFPGALRITVDVFDKERRLERPIRHVMVIPIGG